MAVKPDKQLSKADILHCFSHEYRFTHPNFYDQSELVLTSFILTFMRKEESFHKKEKSLLFRFRCSLLMLPNSLHNLARQICPELGRKEVFDHESVTLDSLNQPYSYS